jgi:excisionase family DNA binding protein
MDASEKWLSVKEVSAILGCSVDMVRRLVKRGRMKAVRLSVNVSRRVRTYVTLRISSLEVARFIRDNLA